MLAAGWPQVGLMVVPLPKRFFLNMLLNSVEDYNEILWSKFKHVF